MLIRSCRKAGPKRKGIVLIAVLVVVVVLTLAAYQYSELMMAEYKAADSYTRSAQARALADSGIHFTAAMLSNPNSYGSTLNGNPYDNPQVFQGVIVSPDDRPRFQGRFSIVARLGPDDTATSSQPFRYGVTDESGKINLNALMLLDSSGKIAHDMLILLPNMTEDIANAILDWMDPDDDPRSNGAESSYYSSLSPPYRCKNGPLDSLEELLLVRGVTPQLLFGNDRNRNGILDPDEDDGTGVLDQGWSAYLTVYSRELNVDSQGNPRIYVNDNDLNGLSQKLTTAVGPDLANYIIAYRVYGPASTQSSSGSSSRSSGPPGAAGSSSGPRAPGGAGSSSGRSANVPGGAGSSSGRSANVPGGQGGSPRLSSGNINTRSGSSRSISSLYELVNSSVSIPGSTPQAQPIQYPSPLNDPGSLKQLMPLLLDSVTTNKASEIPARINVNTAPQAVLASLPGLTDADVQNIITQRPALSTTDAPDPIFQTPAWLITQANFDPTTLKTLEKYITAQSQVYRVQSVGYFDTGGPTARVEAVIDTNAGRPRILYWRDLTELGKGFDLQNSSQQ
jgi:type II secretory pathway component PulK